MKAQTMSQTEADLPLRSTSVRLSERSLTRAKELGVDVPELFRHALEVELIHKSGQCPTCGAVIRR